MASPRGIVLLVDDDRVLLSALSHWLTRDGWEVAVAHDAASARRALQRNTFDAMIVDFVLPDGDGVQVVTHARSLGLDMPVLALTAAASESVVEALVRAGANHVLDKAGLTRGALVDALDLAGASPVYPREPAVARGGLDEEAPGAAPAPGRALVIDDVAATRRLVRAHLSRAGWTVDEAETAGDGVRRASTSTYDVILLDYLLPDVDGVGALHEMRRRGCETPVIVLSAHGAEDVATEFAHAGAADFLPKETLTHARLLSAVGRALGATATVKLAR